MKAINFVMVHTGDGNAFIDIESDEGLSLSIGSVIHDYAPDINPDYWAIRITPEDIINASTDRS